MKKFFLALALALFTFPTFSQVTFGLRLAPSIASNRVNSEIDTTEVTNFKSGLRMSIGPTLDINFSDNASFSTGLWYASKRAGLSYNDTVGGTNVDEVAFKLHYLQIPLTIKYYTNNISDKIRLYFQFGGTLDINITDDINESKLNSVDQKSAYGDGTSINTVSILDATAYIGAGGEYEIGETNVLFYGISYNRGLMNVLSNDLLFETGKGGLSLSNDLISLEVGIKF